MISHIHYRSDVQHKTDVWKISKPKITPQSRPSTDALQVNFMLYKSIEVVQFEEGDDAAIITPRLKILVTQETVKVPRAMLLSERGTLQITEILSGMLVPVDEQPNIIGKVLNAVESTLSMLPIVVEIEEVTLRMRINIGNPTDVIGRVTRESMETYEVKPSRATKSSIDGLERVRLDSSEASGECVICMKLFEAGVEVIHLPCLHFYHGDCIVQWLEISHLCPLCRHSMPH